MSNALIMLGLLWVSPLWGNSVRFPEPSPAIVHVATNKKYTTTFTNPNQENTEEVESVYIPVESATNGNYNTQGDDFRISLISASVARTEISIPADVEITEDSETWHLFVAAKEEESDNYRVIHNAGQVRQDGRQNVVLDVNDICSQDATLDINCEKFQEGEPKRAEITLFISIGREGEVDAGNDADSIDIDNYDGFSLVLKLSSAITPRGPTIGGLQKSDGRLRVLYNGDGIEEALDNKAYIIDRGDGEDDVSCAAIAPSASDWSALSGGQVVKLSGSPGSGRSMVKNLINNHCYSVQVYYEDKYHFASRVSAGLSAIPENLEALLKKQACFFLSAGFGGEHFIVNYFRRFRDQSLSSFAAGRWFVRFYENNAAPHALKVAQNPTLAFAVRCLAWVAWFLLEYGLIVLAALGMIIALLLKRRWRFGGT